MSAQDYDSSVSGYLTDGFEGISSIFTEVEILHRHEHYTLARAKRYGRWWMLKAIKEEVAGQTIYQQMLRKELELLMQMQSPHVVQASGMEQVEGLGMCIVMEYVDGIQLDEWLKKSQDIKSRLRIAEELLEAIVYVHSTGTVHRDLKPENIMVTRNGEHIKLIDFGLADNDHMAILKQPAGTPKYMAPEQTICTTPDNRNDIYSIGIILQQLLPERKFKPVIGKCFLPIEKRYKNVNDLLHALQHQTKQRQRITISAFVLLIVLLAAGLGVQTLRQHQLEKRINTAIEEGVKKIDLILNQIAMEERLDTCTEYSYISKYYQEHLMDGDQVINQYTDSIRPLFNQAEIYEIIYALYIHYGNRLKVWSDKCHNLLMKDINDNERTTLH